MAATLESMLAAGADSAPALAAPGRPTLTHGGLRELVRSTLATLNAAGAGRNDRVAIVLDNGPEMAACFIACAAGTASAPLNPGYRADEFEFYLADLNAKLLIVAAGSASPAVAVAQKLGVGIVDLVVGEGAPAGSFTLESRVAPNVADALPIAHGGFSVPADTAMVLHTSGTTSRPKIVPLSVANLCASAANIGATLALQPADRGLNIMPL
ncbi:MAG: AMP-binding protein, partial [Caldimonas sp.]